MRLLFVLTTLFALGCHALTGLDAFDVAGDGGGGMAHTGGDGGQPAQGGGMASGGGTATGGTGGSGGRATCFTALRDDFTGELSPAWNPWGGNVSVTNDALRVLWSGGTQSHSGVISNDAQALSECALAIELVTPPPEGATQAFMYAQHTIDDRVGFYVLNGRLHFAINDADGPNTNEDIPFVHAEHRWWRLRHEDDNLFWDTAPDGVDWTLRRQAASPTFDLAAIPLNIGGGATTSTTQAGSIAFDNFNLPP